eukprot:761689-Hanusia_phi.AAC.1
MAGEDPQDCRNPLWSCSGDDVGKIARLISQPCCSQEGDCPLLLLFISAEGHNSTAATATMTSMGRSALLVWEDPAMTGLAQVVSWYDGSLCLVVCRCPPASPTACGKEAPGEDEESFGTAFL